MRIGPLLVVLALDFVLLGRAAAADDVLAFVGGDVHTATGPVLSDATVIVRGGKVEFVGKGVDIPAGARRIELKGAIVTPGFIDADSALPISDLDRNMGRGGVDWRAADAVRGDDARLVTARAQGVTAFLATGSERTAFGGIAALVVGDPTRDAVVATDGPIVVNLSDPDVAGGIWGASRLAEVRGAFVAARDRRDELDRRRRDVARYEEKRAADAGLKEERLLLPPELLEQMAKWSPADRAAWREAAMKSMGREKEYVKPKDASRSPGRIGDDPALDLLATAFATKDATPRRAWIRAESDADVAAALHLATEFGLTVTVAGGEGLVEWAHELVRAKIEVVVTELGDAASHDDGPLADRAPGLAARLVAAGLHPALSAGGQGGGSRFLRLLAAAQIGQGLDPENALRGVTVWAAEAAGAQDIVGSIAPGRRADLVVWDGDPFAATSKPRLVVVGGVVVEGER